ncbi:MAG TPA: NADH-quinone oxidoreductase subunit M [Chloroflexota bacterium]|nr:NADH-quinone oxidoreductase subunit M [Chloroflexota bacterium]
MDALLTLVIFLPLAGGVLVWLLPSPNPAAGPVGPEPGSDVHHGPPVAPPNTPRTVAALVSGLVLLLSLVLFVNYDRALGGFQFQTNVPWIGLLGVSYHIGIDGISLPLVVLNALLTFLAILVSWNLGVRPREYFALVLILETAVAGVFSSLDLFLFFLFWELELAPMFLLIGVWGGPRREYAAMKFLIYTVLGGAFMLLGILVLYFASGLGTFDMLALQQYNFAPAVQLGAFVLLYIAFAVKIPVFPFHTWLPDAHVEAPTAISVLLAGVLLKMGGYGLIRIAIGLLPAAAQQAATVLAVLAVINILYGAMLALGQSDLKKIIANSSVSHMGFVVLGASAMTQIGFEGAVLQMFTHGTITGLLFMMVGLVYDRTHTREVGVMGGLAAQMPKIATVFVIAGLASLGLPGLSGFVAEFVTFVGTFDSHNGAWWGFAVLGTFGVVLAAGYILWMLERVFYGPLSDRWKGLPDATRLEMVTIGALVAVIVLVGVYPNLLLGMIANSVAPIVSKIPT